MAGYFNVAYPPNEDYVRFNGGKNSKIQKNIILDNQSPDCLNVIIDDDSVITRPGTAKLNTSSVGSFACDGFYTRHERDSTAETMCAWFGGSLFTLTGASTFTTVPSAQSIYTAGTKVYAVEYQNNMFFGAGQGNIPTKYTGSEFSRQGIYPATATMGVSTATTAGSLTGSYRYAMAYVNSFLVESDLNPLTGTFTVASGIASLSSIPIAPKSWGVSTRSIYRTDNSGTVLYYAGSIANNTATTYVDEINDAELGAEAALDQNVPPNYGPCLYHQSRLFVIGRYPSDSFDRVYYSDIQNPYVFGTTNFIDIGDNTNDIPEGLNLWDNYLIVTGARGTTWLIYMPDTDDTNWVQLRLRSQYGSKSHLGMFSAMNYLIFPAVERDKFVGFGALSASGLEATASQTDVGAVGADLLSNVIEDEMFNISNVYLKNIASIVYKNKAYITATTGNSTYNNRIFVFDFSTNGLQKSQKYTWIPWTGINAAQFTVYNGNLYYASADPVGFVYAMNQSPSNDSGVAINSYWWSKEFGGQPAHTTWYKDWRFLNILYGLLGDFNMGLTIRVDSDQGDGTTYDLDCSPGSETWGSLVWGSDNWDAGRGTKDLKYPLGQFRGKRIQFKYSNKNTVNQKFQVIGINLTYNLKGRR